MTKHTILLLIMFLAFAVNSCNKEEKLTLDPLEEKAVPNNPTDQKIADFLEKYESKIIYEWDRRYTSSDAKVFPVKFELVLPFIELIEKIWIAPYDAQSPGFMRENMPIEIVLVGSNIQYREGDENGFNAAGQAMSLSRILLAGVNDMDLENEYWISNQVMVMHHEFAHILDKKFGRPQGYDEISKGKYAGTSSFTQFSMSVARERGFWEPYGMTNEAEDFATFVTAMVQTPKQDFLDEISNNDLLKRKYSLVNQYYSRLGVNLHQIQSKVVDIVNELKTGK